jgi:hypothetical protein
MAWVVGWLWFFSISFRDSDVCSAIFTTRCIPQWKLCIWLSLASSLLDRSSHLSAMWGRMLARYVLIEWFLACYPIWHCKLNVGDNPFSCQLVLCSLCRSMHGSEHSCWTG